MHGLIRMQNLTMMALAAGGESGKVGSDWRRLGHWQCISGRNTLVLVPLPLLADLWEVWWGVIPCPFLPQFRRFLIKVSLISYTRLPFAVWDFL